MQIQSRIVVGMVRSVITYGCRTQTHLGCVQSYGYIHNTLKITKQGWKKMGIKTK